MSHRPSAPPAAAHPSKRPAPGGVHPGSGTAIKVSRLGDAQTIDSSAPVGVGGAVGAALPSPPGGSAEGEDAAKSVAAAESAVADDQHGSKDDGTVEVLSEPSLAAADAVASVCSSSPAIDVSGDGGPAAVSPIASDPSRLPVLAVIHGWLRRAYLSAAKQLMVECLLDHGERLAPNRQQLSATAGRVAAEVDVEWDGSGIVLARGLRVPVCAAADCAHTAVELQKAVASLLDTGQQSVTSFQDLRLFAGHGGPELTWPHLCWYPDARGNSPPDEAATALQLLRNGRTVLVATRGNFGRAAQASSVGMC
jgi:hypothetical protein